MTSNPFELNRLKGLSRWSAALWLLSGFQLLAQIAPSGADGKHGSSVPDLPEARSPFVLRAVNDPVTA